MKMKELKAEVDNLRNILEDIPMLMSDEAALVAWTEKMDASWKRIALGYLSTRIGNELILAKIQALLE